MATAMVTIHREAYKQDDLIAIHQTESEEVPLMDVMRKQIKKTCECSGKCMKKKTLETFPFFNTLRNYNLKKNMLYDMMAGLNVGIVHIPQSMGFALLASLPPVYGLYCSFFQPLIYFIFGTSQHNSLGTMAVVSLIIGTAVDRVLDDYLENMPSSLPGNDSLGFNLTLNETGGIGDFDEGVKKAAIATTITLLAGLIQIAMAFFRLGAITTFMPVSFIGGFTTGCSFYIALSQIPALLGISISRHAGIFRLVKMTIDIGKNIVNTNPATVVTSLICMFLLIILKEVINEKYKNKLKVPIPADLIVVVIGTMIGYLAKLEETFGVAEVGDIPRGFPLPAVPPMEFAGNVIADAVVLAIVSFVISISMANLFANKYKYNIDSNQEMLSYGVMHTVSSFFHCFGGASAPPRCVVYEKSGGKTNVGYLFSCVLLLLVILVLGTLFQTLPKAVLASMIFVALFPLFRQFKELALYWKISKFDFFVWLVTWFFTCFTDISVGAGIGVGYVIFAYVFKSLFAKGHILGVLDAVDITMPELSYGKAKQLLGVRIFRFESNLYFATAQRFKKELYKNFFNPRLEMKTVESHTDLESLSSNNSDDKNSFPKKNGDITDFQLKGSEQVAGIRNIILDCSRFTSIDIMGINALRQVRQDFIHAGVSLSLVNCSSEIRTRLKTVHLVGSENSPFTEYPTVQDALTFLALNPNEIETATF